MGFTEAVRTVVKDKYATFKGRAPRSEYWWFALFYWLVILALVVVFGALGALLSSGSDTGFSTAHWALIVPVVVVGLGLILPVIAVQVRRFHDRNMSGWMYLLFAVLSAIPYVGFLASIAIIVISALPGTEGPNKFGADPLRPEATADVFA